MDVANSNGIKIALALNEKDQLVYEYAIPFAALKNKKDPEGMKSNSIDIEIFILAIKLNIPTTISTEPTNYNSSFNIGMNAKLNKVNNARPSGLRTDSKNENKDFFESTKKKIKIELLKSTELYLITRSTFKKVLKLD